MSVKALKDAVKKSAKDKFEVGTVVRWVSSGKYNYAALKTDAGWYTTARSYNNTFVDEVVTFDELLEILARSETTDVAYAETWVEVD